MHFTTERIIEGSAVFSFRENRIRKFMSESFYFYCGRSDIKIPIQSRLHFSLPFQLRKRYCHRNYKFNGEAKDEYHFLGLIYLQRLTQLLMEAYRMGSYNVNWMNVDFPFLWSEILDNLVSLRFNGKPTRDEKQRKRNLENRFQLIFTS